MRCPNLRVRWLCAPALAGLLMAAILAPAASAAPPATQALHEVRSGERPCSSLSRADFGRIGDVTMRRMVGSAAAHESMDALMSDMMGGSWERRMHVALGERAAGCGDRLPADFRTMMGALGMMGERGEGEYGPGATGEDRGDYGPGMMGDEWSGPGASDEGGDGPSAAAMLGVMAVLIGAVGAGVLWLSRHRGGGNAPLETLKRRYADGELSTEQYEESKRLLEGS